MELNQVFQWRFKIKWGGFDHVKKREENDGVLCSEASFMGNSGLSQSERAALFHLDTQEPK